MAPGAGVSMRQPNKLECLLGLMFAGADLFLEVDRDGAITFVAGAALAITGQSPSALAGMPWTSLFEDTEFETLSAIAAAIPPGERLGPVPMTLSNRNGEPRRVALSVFRAPGRDEVLSCAVSVAGADLPNYRRTSEGLLETGQFEHIAASLLERARSSGTDAELQVLSLDGLDLKTQHCTPQESTRMRRQLAGILRSGSYAGAGAAELAPNNFALVRERSKSNEGLAEQITIATEGAVRLKIAILSDTNHAALSPRAIRFAIGRLIEAGMDESSSNVARAFDWAASESQKFECVIREQSFRLVYQPIVELKDEALHHFEALSRFDGEESPAETIRLAEELDLIVDFDIAVLGRVSRQLSKHPGASIAANVSAKSLANHRFMNAALLHAEQRSLSRRLLIEITETQHHADLGNAAHNIDVLRRAGFKICLDDFGAGAASLDYIRQLNVDYVKFDGRFIHNLSSGSRDAVLLKHLVRLCDELKIATVAEVIETRATAAVARELGVRLGQGWAFGKPQAELQYTPPRAQLTGRRRGEVEQWA